MESNKQLQKQVDYWKARYLALLESVVKKNERKLKKKKGRIASQA